MMASQASRESRKVKLRTIVDSELGPRTSDLGTGGRSDTTQSEDQPPPRGDVPTSDAPRSHLDLTLALAATSMNLASHSPRLASGPRLLPLFASSPPSPLRLPPAGLPSFLPDCLSG